MASADASSAARLLTSRPEDRLEAAHRAGPKQILHTEVQPSLKVFVSYARADLAFADKLVAALEAHGIEVRIDRRDLPFARVWQEELVEMVRSADTVLFLISPDSIGSQWCEWELAQVEKYQKRLGPIVCRPVENDRIPEGLSKLQHISFAPPSDFNATVKRLVEQLGTDIDWVRQHTDFADAARDWKDADRASDFLLRGAALRKAQSWLDARPPMAPAPTAEQLDLISASERAASRRRLHWAAAAIAVALIASGLAGLAYWQREVAIANEEIAQTNEKVARRNEERANAERDQALRNQSLFLADQSRQETERGNATNGILLALEALPKRVDKPDRPYLPEAERALYQAVSQNGQLVVLKRSEDSVMAAFSPDGTMAMRVSKYGSVGLWHADSGKSTTALQAQDIRAAAVSPDWAKVVTVSWGGSTARLWDAASGNELAVLQGHEGEVSSAAFSPDGAKVVTASEDLTARLWDAASGKELAVLRGHEKSVLSAAFSPDGAKVITTSSDSTARLWDVATGQGLTVLRGHGSFVWSVAFSPDGAKLATASADHFGGLWHPATGQVLAVLEGHNAQVLSAAFSPDGAKVVTASENRTARLWDATSGKELAVLQGHEGQVKSASFSPDGAKVVSASSDGTVRLWDAAGGTELAALQEDGPVQSAAFSLDGAKVLIVSQYRGAIWPAARTTQELIDYGRSIVPRQLTPEQRKQFFLE